MEILFCDIFKKNVIRLDYTVYLSIVWRKFANKFSCTRLTASIIISLHTVEVSTNQRLVHSWTENFGWANFITDTLII